MYETFFGLTAKPFTLVPDPEFLFLSKSHKRTLSFLDYGIKEGAAFILLTGETGSGKTTIIRDLLRRYRDRVVLSMVFNTDVDFVQLLTMINDDFGLPTQGKEKVSLLQDLNTFLIDQFVNGNKPILIIDEAQNLAPKVLEDIRMLSNLETDKAKLLQIMLVGQPELRDTLSQPGLLQLRQRISIICYINPLFRVELDEYILHRLSVAGNRTAVVFTIPALDIIYKCSRGIPRLINIICDYLMLYAFAQKSKDIDETMAQDVVGKLDFENYYWSGEASLESEGQNEREAITLHEAITPDTHIASLLGKIDQRLDRLENELSELSAAVTGNMDRKLTELTDSFVQDINESNASDFPAAEKKHDAGYEHIVIPRLEQRIPRKSLWKKIFG